MDLYIRAPMFTPLGKPILDQRIDELQAWWKTRIQSLRQEFKLQKVSVEPILPQVRFQLSGQIQINLPEELDSLVPKGLCVRLELFAILDAIDSIDVARRNDSYFVLIDGSGAFAYDSIRSILGKLSQESPVVLGLRDPKTGWGMGPGRKEIELFEMSLLEDRYRQHIQKCLGVPNLPDAQAGCWGFNLGAAKSLPLTARDYGLEFDVIASTLAAGLPFAFAPVTLSDQRTSSSFRPEDSMKKLRFIQHKLKYSDKDVVKKLKLYLGKYRDVENRAIPSEYTSSLRKSTSSTWRRSSYRGVSGGGDLV